MTRDPRIDPRQGDIVRAGDGRERRVDETFSRIRDVRRMVRWTGFGWTGSGPGWQSSVTGWQRWCRKNKAVVVETAAEKK